MGTMPSVSVVIPVYNGAETISTVVQATEAALSHCDHEIILVNDGSPDRSEQVCMELAATHPNVVALSLRKNFGEHNAVMCGLHHTKGEYVAILDDDMQNPPSEILKLLEVATSCGFDVVYGQYQEKHHPAFRRFGSWFNGLAATWLLKKPRNLYLCSFKLIHRDVVREIARYTGPFPYIDGLIFQITQHIGRATVEHQARASGHSGYTLKKLISLYLNMFLGFSILPLRVFTLLGSAVFVLGLIASGLFVIEKIQNPDLQLGWASIIVSVITLSGVQIVFLGVLGEYLGKQHFTLNRAPQWIIRKQSQNCPHAQPPP